MLKELRTALTLFLLLLLVTGFGYPMLVLGIGQSLFPQQANGSLLTDNGKIIGSILIGQNFTDDKYFHPRPSAAGNGYDAGNSSASNFGPTSTDVIKAVGDRVADLRKSENMTTIPVDLVTASASGLDPDISPAAARLQITRIALARNINILQIRAACRAPYPAAHIRHSWRRSRAMCWP